MYTLKTCMLNFMSAYTNNVCIFSFTFRVRSRRSKADSYITYGVSQPSSKFLEAEAEDLAYNTCVRPPMWTTDDSNATMAATMGRQQPYKQTANSDMRSLPRNMNGYNQDDPYDGHAVMMIDTEPCTGDLPSGCTSGSITFFIHDKIHFCSNYT